MPRYLVVLVIVLIAFSPGLAAAQTTLEVSQPVQVTNSGYYERGQAMTYDGSDYWLIYGRSASVNGNYQNSNPDTNDYDVYFKKAGTVPGLVTATAGSIPGASNSYLGEMGAAYFGSEVWAFATIDLGAQADIYGWYTTDGSSWTQVASMATGLSTGAAHHDEVTFGGEMFLCIRRGDDFYTTHTTTPKTGGWSTEVGVGSAGGLGHFFIDGGTLYLAILKSPAPRQNEIWAYNSGLDSWSLVSSSSSTGWDPTLFKVGSQYVFAQAPWTSEGGGRQYVIAWTGTSLSNVFDAGPVMVVEGRCGINTWVDMWPIGFTDAGGTSYLFYTSERDQPTAEGTGNIWYLEVDWDPADPHHTYVQEAIDAASSLDQINVAAGNYAERLTIGKSLDLHGAQYGVDPTQTGARTNPAVESTIDISALSVQNPNVAVEIPGGITDVTISGFTLIGSPTSHYADESVIRCWDDDLTIEDNILDGYFGIVYKGNDDFAARRNRMVVNKGGIASQPNPATNVTIADNSFALGASPAGDESAIYLTSVTTATVSGNTATGFVNSKGVAGSNVSQITVSENTFTGNKDAISFWGTTTFVTIEKNDLSNSLRYGISIKGQDIDITNNLITNCADTGVNVDRHVIDTERVTISDNDLGGNTNFGVQVNTGVVTETVDASGNWWGAAAAAAVAAEANGGSGVDYTPWLDVGTDTSADPGFQGDFSTLWVDDGSPQGGGGGGRIQEGVDLVSGSTVHVLGGTYNESLVLASGFATDGVVISGETSDRPVLTGGVRFLQTATIDGITFENLYIKGVAAGGNMIFDMDNTGDVDDFMMDNCVIDGENVSGRPSFGGQNLGQTFTMTGCEFKDILGWAVIDIDSGSGDGGSARVFTTVTFADNYVHDCNGSVALRGNATTRTTTVNVYGNTFTNIGGNQAEQGEQWAALEINHAEMANVYDNLVDDVALGIWGEGQAFQFWDIGTLNLNNNILTNNYQGVFFFGGGGVYGGPYAVPGGAISYNTISGNSQYGIEIGSGATGGPLNAEMNWWGDASGPTHSGNPSGTGDASGDNVDYTPWIGMTGGGNVVCVPDPRILNVGAPTNSVTVRYLGGGSGLVYGYSIAFSWDETKVTLNSVTQENLLSSLGSTVFQVVTTGSNSRRVDCALLGDQAGVFGPGDMFTISFTGTGCGESDIDLTILEVRDMDNTGLSGFFEDDGQLQIDISAPSVGNVLITNTTLAHTNDYAKDTDDLTVTADVSDGCDYGTLEASDITADLSDLLDGGGATVAADSYAGGVATWTLTGVTLTTDGTKTVTVTATDLLDNPASASDQITVDNTAPTAIAGFDAEPGHNRVELSWGDPSGSDTYFDGLTVRRTAWGDYPEYDTAAPSYPADEAAGSEAFNGTGTGATDSFLADGSERDIYYYQAYAYDIARNYGPADEGARDRATNYWLGDVRPSSPLGDGEVKTADIDALGTTYGKNDGDAGFENHCDVGPTDDNGRLGIPEPDDYVGFEDMMVFAMNFGVVNPLKGPGTILDLAGSDPARVGLHLDAPVWISSGEEFVAGVRLDDPLGIVQGIRFVLLFDPAILELREVLQGSLVSDATGPTFFKVLEGEENTKTMADVSAAALGQGATFGGSGDVVRFRFRSRMRANPDLRINGIQVRDVFNREIPVTEPTLDQVSVSGGENREIPTRLFLSAESLLSSGATLSFGLPEGERVILQVYDVSGKLLKTLVDEQLTAGVHSVIWSGDVGRGRTMAAGLYFAKLQTESGSTITKKLIVMQ